LAALARAIAGRFQAWRNRQAVLSELYCLDHWTLSDLRIHPCDFTAIADGTYKRHGAPDNEPEAPRRALPPRVWPR
jgi:hypothetical protein